MAQPMKPLETSNNNERTEGADAEYEIVHICKIQPHIESILDPEMKLNCPVSGCRKLIRNCLVARHIQSHISPSEAASAFDVNYYCPGENCAYSLTDADGPVFESMKALRQHYKKVHAPKKLSCDTCPKSFSTNTYLNAHKRVCDILFQCSCNKSFASLESLRTHARRRAHSFELEMYQKVIQDRKTQELEKMETCVVEETATPAKPRGQPRQKFNSKDVPILPKVTLDDPGVVARLVFHPVKKTLSIDISTQTTPLLVRKRSATQHSQTEYKVTKTTGTLTVAPLTSTSDTHKHFKRKTSAQTQTKKLKISTETQTPVVTKRKRCMRKKQITTATTQTPQTAGPRPSSTVTEPEPDLISSYTSQPTSPPPLLSSMFESFDEVHIETQTDPNPFFGYPNSALPPHLDVFLSEDADLEQEDEGQGMSSSMSSNLKTSETQTSPTRRMSSEGTRPRNQTSSRFEPLNNGDYFTSNPSGADGNDSNLTLQSPSIDEDLDTFCYLETMDSETQTTFFESRSFSDFLY